MTELVNAMPAALRMVFYFFVMKAFEACHNKKKMVENWHIQCLAYYLEMTVTEEGENRLIIAMPPRALKSFCASVAYPLWILMRDPSKKIICISYNDDLAKHFALKRRMILENSWFRALCPGLEIIKLTDTELVTSAGGEILTTSVCGTLTGFGADYIVIDDPIKAGDTNSEASRKAVNDWYRHTLYSRLDNKEKGVIVIVAQRTHEDDLIGSVEPYDHWTVLNLPALAVEDETYLLGANKYYHRKKGEALHEAFESAETLQRTELQMGSYHFAAQYQQNPMPPEGNLFKLDWLVRLDCAPDLFPEDIIIQSWDLASGLSENNDYSVCVTISVREEKIFIRDIFRERLAFPELLRQMEQQWRIHRAHRVVVENVGIGLSALQSLSKTRMPLLPFNPKVDKITRAEQVSAIIEQGRVSLPKDAPWLDDFLSEFRSFPSGKHDDQMDALTQALLHSDMQRERYLNSRVTIIGTESAEVVYQDSYFERTGIPCF